MLEMPSFIDLNTIVSMS